MSKPKNYLLDLPPRMEELWEWVVALDAWDYCAPELLAGLIKLQPVPEELKPSIANIITGERQPKRRAAAKLKIPAAERMKIAGSLSTVIGLADLLANNDYEPGLDNNADRHAAEPIEIIRNLESEKRNAISKAANDLNVSTETIENLLRDLRQKIEHWPSL